MDSIDINIFIYRQIYFLTIVLKDLKKRTKSLKRYDYNTPYTTPKFFKSEGRFWARKYISSPNQNEERIKFLQKYIQLEKADHKEKLELYKLRQITIGSECNWKKKAMF